MKLPTFTFRVLLPIVYLVLAVLPVVGMILTIAEGPNPFGFLLFVSMPGFYLLDLVNHVLPLPRMNMWIELLFGMLLNIGIYFVVGYLIDYAIKRLRHRESSNA
jgi:hypothetical protein